MDKIEKNNNHQLVKAYQSAFDQILMLVPRTSKIRQLLVLLHKPLMKIFTHTHTTNTVTVLTLPTIKLPLVRYLQLLCTNVLRHIALTMPTVRTGTLCT